MKDLLKIEEIYFAALEKSPFEREAFLSEVCGYDSELRREVESLLKFDEKAVDFIETPPEDIAADFFSNEQNSEIIGKILNHYHVLSPLGAGGMGEVYLAEDIKLARKIAVKLLPPQFAADSERKRRFEQEARAISALNHPNIITIFGIEETENYNFIATEFIDGETLRDCLEREPFAVEDFLDFAIQLSSALEAAHSVGIIHRDIKPANIMIRRDKIIKILDFGLAKLTSVKNLDECETRDLTAPERVLGTINYMSPEQALGEKLDGRTDIFSLGVVFYEMLTRVQPFKGNSEAAIYDRILNKEPVQISEIRKDIPPDVEELVSRAMEKKAKDRFQNAAELRTALENVKRRINSGEMISAKRFFKGKSFFKKKKTAVFSTIAAAFAVIFFTTGFLFFINQSNHRAVSIKDLNYRQLTKSTGADLFPSLSPDGKSFIYSSRKEGNWNIYFQQVGEINSTKISKDAGGNDFQAVFSPDGEQIAFRSERSGGGIFLMDKSGENVRQLTDSGYYPSWSPDGKEIVFSSENFEVPMNRGIFSSLWIVNIETGEKRKLLDTQDAIQPNWSPSGERIAFWGFQAASAQRDIWTVSVSGDALVRVTNEASVDWNPVWSPDGKYLYFASDRGGSMNLWRVAINEYTGEITDKPETITTPSTYSQNISFSRQSKNFVYVQSNNYSNILKADLIESGEKFSIENETEITPGSMWATNPEISPDGERIVFDNIGDEQEDIFVMPKNGSEIRRLTDDKFKDRTPVWSPDGQKIAFFSDRNGRYDGYVMSADGSDLRQLTESDEKVWMQFPIWSPDGEKLLFNRSFSLPVLLDPAKTFTEQIPQVLPVENPPPFWIMWTDWTSDGKNLIGYVNSKKPADLGIFIYSFETRRIERLTDFSSSCFWLKDNRRVLFIRKDKIYLLDTETKKQTEVLSVAPNRLDYISISQDYRTIYFSLQKNEADIWLAQSN